MSDESPNPAGGTHDVFVSYASQDVAVADAIVGTLERIGLKCWIAPRDVMPGALYADGIIRANNDMKVMVLVLSANSIASKHVGKEVERASSKGRPIITLKVDATSLTTALEYFLSESQWIDVPALGMPAALKKLVEAVGQGLAASPGVNPVLGAGLAASGTPGTRRPVGVRRVALVASVIVAMMAAVALGFHFWATKHADTRMRAVDKSIAARAVKAEYCPRQEENPRGSRAGRDCNDYSAGDRSKDNQADRTLMSTRKRSGATPV